MESNLVSNRILESTRAPQVQERRRHRRFSVAGGLVRVQCAPFEVYGARARVKPLGLVGLLRGYSRDYYEVINLSRGGMALESDRPLRRGQRVRVCLKLPCAPFELTLQGEVRWQRIEDGGLSYRAGVCFDPFGGGPGNNPREALATLRELEERYATPDNGKE